MTTGGPPLAMVHGLVKRYGKRTVVDDVGFEIVRGECFTLLGPNGAGKTTTLEIMQGLRTRDAGTVEVLGVDPLHGDRRWRSRVGVVSQTMSQGLDISVAEMVDHFAHYHANSRATSDLLAAVGMTDSASVRVPNLSGGQRRRLEVALAIQGRPEMLFLDEPTTGLDPVARRAFWVLVDSLRDEGTTILLTTHYLDEAERLADRAGVIAGGRLVRIAPPDRLGDGLGLNTRISYRLHGEPTTVSVKDPVPALRDLLGEHLDGEITELDVRRPRLEDVYLELIGHTAEEAS